MARKLLLGKAGSDYGLFVSKTDASGNTTDVVNDSGVLTDGTNLLFDSRVGIGSLPLKFHGQGTIGLPSTSTDTLTGDTFATITHNLGYKPFVIVQWCFSTDVTSGVATKMYPAMHFYYDEYDYDIDGSREEEFNAEFKGGVWFEVSNTALKIYNNFAGGLKTAELNDVLEEQEIISPLEIKYAFLIFDVEGVDTA
jgi:hypothetical protein